MANDQHLLGTTHPGEQSAAQLHGGDGHACASAIAVPTQVEPARTIEATLSYTFPSGAEFLAPVVVDAYTGVFDATQAFASMIEAAEDREEVAQSQRLHIGPHTLSVKSHPGTLLQASARRMMMIPTSTEALHVALGEVEHPAP